MTHNGGTSWQQLTADDGLPKGDLGRIGLAIARSDPRVVYALVEAKKSVLLRSTDGGVSFQTINRETGIANRPFYYADLRVDPTDPKRVYSLASVVTVSDDGGKSFTRLSRGVHPDHHALWIHPDDPTLLYEGNDGGVAISTDRGATWRFVTTLPLAQFYHLDVDMEVPYNVYGGLQDNGSWRGPSSVWENGGIRNHHWHEVGFGDGFRTLPDPVDASIGYAMSQQGYLHRWDLETGQRKAIRPAPDDAELRFNWNAGIAIDPFDPATIYFGSQFVHRSKDRGEVWERISDDLTTNNPAWQKQGESGGLTLDVTGAENYTTIIAIAPSPVQRGVVWVGTDDGRLHLTRDDGRSWTSVEANLPGAPDNTWIPHVEPSRFSPGTAYVVLDDHRRSNWTTFVYRTTDWGQNWTSLVTDDLRGYALTLAEDPVDEKLLFLGTEFGLWFTVDGGQTWQRLQAGLPTVSTMALEVHPRDHDLVVGTHGRAAYIVDDISVLRGLSAEIMTKPLHLFAIGDAQQYRVKQTGASRFPADGEFRGENRPYGAMITFVANGDDLLKDGGGDEENGGEKTDRSQAQIEVRDERDEVICSFEHPIEKGLNRVTWNLRRDSFRRPRGDTRRQRSGPGPNGPEVLPRVYTVNLTIGEGETEHHAEQSVRVLPDPRIDVPAADRRARWQAILEVGGWQELIADASDRIAETRADLDVVTRKAERAREQSESKPHEELLDSVKKLRKTLDELEAQLRGPRDVQGIPPRDHVLGKIGAAMRPLSSSWDAVTPAQQRYIEVARRALEDALPEVNRVFAEDVARFRQSVKASGLVLFPEHAELRSKR